MYATLDIIKAGRITKVQQVDSLAEDFYPEGVVFSMFLNPAEGSDVELGSVVIVEAILPDTNGEYVDVPVVVGDWSPVIFRALKASAIDTDKLDVYISPIKDIVL